MISFKRLFRGQHVNEPLGEWKTTPLPKIESHTDHVCFHHGRMNTHDIGTVSRLVVPVTGWYVVRRVQHLNPDASEPHQAFFTAGDELHGVYFLEWQRA